MWDYLLYKMGFATFYKQIMIVFLGYLIYSNIRSFRKRNPRSIKKAFDEIVKIIQDFQYNDELSEKYKREILDQNKIYD